MNGELIIQEERGIRNLVAAEVLKDTIEEFVCDTPFPVAGISTLTRTTSNSSESHYYDNEPKIVIAATGADEVSIDTSAIENSIYAKITGQHYDESLGMLVEGERDDKYFAIGYITEKNDGTEIFVWRLKGKFGIPDSTHNTKTDGTEANGQSLTYTGVNTIHKFNSTEKSAKAINVNTKINPWDESEFFEAVQTPDTIKEHSTNSGTDTGETGTDTEEPETP